MRAWCVREFAEHGLALLSVQVNMGFSVRKRTVRGMHFQAAPALEAKLVRCTRGAIFDVVLDLRPEPLTYGKWYGTELSAENGRMLYVPEHCAHGYQTLRLVETLWGKQIARCPLVKRGSQGPSMQRACAGRIP